MRYCDFSEEGHRYPSRAGVGWDRIHGGDRESRDYPANGETVEDGVRIAYAVREAGKKHAVRMLTSSNELVETVMEVAGKDLNIKHVEAAVDVHSRRFSKARTHSLGWNTTTSLKAGIAETYRWIEEQVSNDGGRQTIDE